MNPKKFRTSMICTTLAVSLCLPAYQLASAAPPCSTDLKVGAWEGLAQLDMSDIWWMIREATLVALPGTRLGEGTGEYRFIRGLGGEIGFRLSVPAIELEGRPYTFEDEFPVDMTIDVNGMRKEWDYETGCCVFDLPRSPELLIEARQGRMSGVISVNGTPAVAYSVDLTDAGDAVVQADNALKKLIEDEARGRCERVRCLFIFC